MTTGYVFHPDCLWHDTGTSAGLLPANPTAGVQSAVHVENPEAKRRVHELIHAEPLTPQRQTVIGEAAQLVLQIGAPVTAS